MKTKTQIINLVGGPGVGKSTIAAGVFSKLRQAQISAELVSEYPKELVWEEHSQLLDNQIYVFAEQFRRQFRLLDKVDFVITDSPLILQHIYFQASNNKFFSTKYIALTEDFMISTFREFNNISFYIERHVPFENNGRVHSLTASQKLDEIIRSTLRRHEPDYYECDGGTTTIIDEISTFILNKNIKN